MPTGSSGPPGTWQATRIVPPAAPAEAGAELAPALAPADAGALLDVLPPQAMMTVEIAAPDSPRTVARWMNARRLSLPRAYASTTSSCNGVVDLRTESNLR